MTVQGAARIYRSWIQRWHIQTRFPHVDWSIVDLWLARKLLAMHIPPKYMADLTGLGLGSTYGLWTTFSSLIHVVIEE
jgi:hypothetical protein